MQGEITNRKSANISLKNFNYGADADFIEVTEWANGEGYTVNISAGNKELLFDITFGELAALNYLTNALDHNLT